VGGFVFRAAFGLVFGAAFGFAFRGALDLGAARRGRAVGLRGLAGFRAFDRGFRFGVDLRLEAAFLRAAGRRRAVPPLRRRGAIFGPGLRRAVMRRRLGFLAMGLSFPGSRRLP